MLFQTLSDLHLEVHGQSDLPATDARAILLAGDVSEGLEGVEWALAQARLHGKPVIYVPGNHEYFFSTIPGFLTCAKTMAIGSDLTILERNVHVVDNCRILGCTLWTDFMCLGDVEMPASKLAARQKLPDYRNIAFDRDRSLLPDDTIFLFTQSLRWLHLELRRPWKGKTVVMTHHAPSLNSLNPYQIRDMLTPGFASNLEDTLRAYHIDLWLHGHTHHNVDYKVHDTRVVTNQRGYPWETLGGNPYDPALTIRI